MREARAQRFDALKRLFRLATFMVVSALSVSATQFPVQVKPTPAERELGLRLRAGEKLTAEEASALESGLSTEPDDAAARVRLLAYYSRQMRLREQYARRYPHLLWIIEHLPQEPLCRHEFLCFPAMSAEQCENGAKLWAANVGKFPADGQVLRNAAAFSKLSDRPTSLEYLRKGRKLEPNEPYWPWEIGFAYELDTVKPSGELDAQNGAECLVAYTETFRLVGSREPQYHLRGRLARAAYYAGEYQIATEHANALIEACTALVGNDAYPRGERSEMVEALHRAKLVLGHVALRAGDLDKACEYLNQAADYLDAPTLKSFGPNMLLALELLREGRAEEVIKYLEKCSATWKHDEITRPWIEDVRAGKEPAFGANLGY